MFLYLRQGTQLIAGKGSGFDALADAAGAIDAGVEAGVTGTVPITPEALIAARPDVIVVTTTGLQATGGIDGLLAVPGIAQTPAAANRRVLDYDDQLLLGGGPRTATILERLATNPPRPTLRTRDSTDDGSAVEPTAAESTIRPRYGRRR